jgi:hypothetical protein
MIFQTYLNLKNMTLKDEILCLILTFIVYVIIWPNPFTLNSIGIYLGGVCLGEILCIIDKKLRNIKF